MITRKVLARTALLFVAAFPSAGQTAPGSRIFSASSGKFAVDIIAAENRRERAGIVILLHGASGPQASSRQLSDLARALAKNGYDAYLPHYLDITHGSATGPEKKFPLLVGLIENLAVELDAPPSGIVLAGYSLGASVALSYAVTHPAVAGAVSWSGSLPDSYALQTTILPRLLLIHGRKDSSVPYRDAEQLKKLCDLTHSTCELRGLPGEGHVFSSVGIVQTQEQILKFVVACLPG